MNENDVTERLREASEAEQRQRQEALERTMAREEEHLNALNGMITQLYEDRMLKRISEDNFAMLMEKTQKEQAEVQVRIESARKRLIDEEQIAYDAQRWKEAISQYADIQELDAHTLNRLIKSIIVHEKIDDTGERLITVEIHFNLQPLPEIHQLLSDG